MRNIVHPTPKKRNLTASQNGVASFTTTTNPTPKKLKRLPHVFDRVLELPFNSDAEVFVQETKECFRFLANGGDITTTDDFQVHVMEILPGVTKIVVRGAQSVDQSSVEDLNIDMWRYRLPKTTLPEDGYCEMYRRAVGCHGFENFEFGGCRSRA
ncbi:uncharacterized protein LOC110614842 [Manihot esculenta]|nr:uncharacterized protein LOC110614842 [Manihot esculenta]